MRHFHQADMTDFYGEVKEAIPDNALTMPQSKEENQSSKELLWTLLMQMIKSDKDHKQDSVSLSIWIVLFDTQRDRKL